MQKFWHWFLLLIALLSIGAVMSAFGRWWVCPAYGAEPPPRIVAGWTHGATIVQLPHGALIEWDSANVESTIGFYLSGGFAPLLEYPAPMMETFKASCSQWIEGQLAGVFYDPLENALIAVCANQEAFAPELARGFCTTLWRRRQALLAAQGAETREPAFEVHEIRGAVLVCRVGEKPGA